MDPRTLKYLVTISLFLAGDFSTNNNVAMGMAVTTSSRRAVTTTTTTHKAASKTKARTTSAYIQPNENKESSSFTSPIIDRPYRIQQERDLVDDDDELLGFFEVGSFQELQQQIGTEILDDQLQQQIDFSETNPNLFLDAHVSDASYLEKVAMSSIPEQLPQPAVNALRQQKKNKKVGVSPTSERKFGLRFAKVQKLSSEEEIELAKMIQRGAKLHNIKSDYEAKHSQKLNKNEWSKLAKLDSTSQLRKEVATYRRAKQLLVSANIGLVHAVVKKQYKSLKHIEATYDELVQEGTLGLLRAAELFDPSRGLRFSTYATIWIKGALNNTHMSETIKLPARDRTKWNKIVNAHNDLVKEKGLVDQQPTPEEVAARVGMDVEEVVVFQRKMKQAKKVLSLDYEYQSQSRSGVDEANGGYSLENDKNFQSDADLAERTQLQADVIAAMARNLDAREARLMRLRYGLTDGRARSLRECAEAMGLSETRVNQLAKGCLKKLREAAEAESLEEYLLTIA